MKKSNIYFVLLILASITTCKNQSPDFYSFPKVDAHVHIRTFNSSFIVQAKTDDFKLLTICTTSSNQENINEQLKFAIHWNQESPEIISFATSFSMENWGEKNWTEQTISRLKEDFKSGAIAVKVWKDIGMTFRDKSGNFIMINNEGFDPVLDFIESENKTLVAHLGEPKNCWLALDSMTVNSDISYFKNHPQYHMFLHPEYPSYEDQIAARDRMLEKHPNLRVVGAHLGSQEWDVDDLARSLDKFPNLAVDMSARICHFQVQNREKVRNFIIKYQDRLLYGTDLVQGETSVNISFRNQIHDVWLKDWEYFTTDKVLNSDKVNCDFQGLNLRSRVIKKIYYTNAIKLYPEMLQ